MDAHEEEQKMLDERYRVKLEKVDSLEQYGDITKGNTLTSKDITIWKVLGCRDSAFALFASGIAFYNITFFEPFLSVELETYGVSPA